MRPDANSLAFTDGLKAVVAGIGFIVQNPRLWGYALVPATWLLILSCGLSGLGIWAGWHAGSVILGDHVSLMGHAAAWLLTIVLWAAAVLVALVLAVALAQPLSGFALEQIARAQEKALRGYAPAGPSLPRALLESTLIGVVSVFVGTVAFGALFMVAILFPPAVAVTAPLKFLIGAWLLAWNFTDYPLALHGVGIGGRFHWIARNFAAFTAFGLLWTLLLFVPGLFFLVLPMGVAGATRLVVARSP